MTEYLLTKDAIAAMPGLDKTHFLNPNAKRNNKSLGDLTGLNNIGFHIIEVAPGQDTTELHMHYFEEECVYILQGLAEATIGANKHQVGPGDFIGYRAGGEAHKLTNNGNENLVCIVVGQRLAQDVGDYPALNKRIYRNQGMPWNLVDLANIEQPVAGRKV